MLIPRYYQNDAVFALWDYFKENDGNPVVAMPTGTGKSLVIASFIRSVYYYYSDQRVLMVTHVKELIDQNFGKLIDIWPTAPAGIYSAGLKRKEKNCAVTYAGIASIANIAKEVGHIDLVIVDECHLVPPKKTSRYWKFFETLRKTNPHVKIIGLTATPYRLGQGLITNQPSIFTDICFDLTTRDAFNRLIDEGFLAPLIPKVTNTEIDVSGVGMSGGEFKERELQEASDKEVITRAAIREAVELGHDRKHWLIYATGREHARNIQEVVEEYDITCGLVTGDMPDGERDSQLAKFKAGELQAMVSVGILTTGFDYPEVDMLVILRPTNSPGLWVQILGRGTRPAEYSDNCLVLDFAGNTLRLGPINDPVIPQPKGKGKGGTAPIRICEGCNTYIHASLRTCPHCGHTVEERVKFTSKAGTAELIAREEKQPEIVTFKVDRVIYKVHHKIGKPDSIKITYYCGLRVFSDWGCILHEGFAGSRGRRWWTLASNGELEVPTSIDEAMAQVNQLRTPTTIEVQVDLKYPEVKKCNYS